MFYFKKSFDFLLIIIIKPFESAQNIGSLLIKNIPIFMRSLYGNPPLPQPIKGVFMFCGKTKEYSQSNLLKNFFIPKYVFENEELR